MSALTHKHPFCRCLHEIRNKLPRTKFCFAPCAAQIEIAQMEIDKRKKDEEKPRRTLAQILDEMPKKETEIIRPKRKEEPQEPPPYPLPQNMQDVLTIIVPRFIGKGFEDTEEFKAGEADFAIHYHHSIGRAIRNEFGLWGDSALRQYFIEQGVEEPDTMSDLILRGVYKELKEKQKNA